MESKSSTIINNFQESIDKESKSNGIEIFALVETANDHEEQPITGV